MLQKRNPGLAGTLRESVTFQRRALDANGDALGPWTDQFATPARVQARTGGARVPARPTGEEVVDDRITGVQPVEITMRLNLLTAQIDTDWRAVWLNWPFGVTAVAVDELASVVTVMATRYRDDNLSEAG